VHVQPRITAALNCQTIRQECGLQPQHTAWASTSLCQNMARGIPTGNGSDGGQPAYAGFEEARVDYLISLTDERQPAHLPQEAGLHSHGGSPVCVDQARMSAYYSQW